MVTVIVGVDHKTHGLVRDPDVFERRLNFLGQRRELVVNQHDAVFAHRGGDISARAFQHVDVSGNFGDLNLDFGKILLLRRHRSAHEEGRRGHGKNHRYPHYLVHAGPQSSAAHCSTIGAKYQVKKVKLAPGRQ